MRVSLLVAMIAVGSTCGYAVALPVLSDTPDVAAPRVAVSTPSAPVLVLDTSPLVQAAAAPARGASVSPLEVASAAQSVLTFRSPERVDRLPSHLLLPDGALVASSGPVDGTPIARGLVLRPIAAPASDLRSDPLPLPAAQLARAEDPGPSTYFQGTRRSAPDAPPLARPVVFEPQAATTSGAARAYWTATGVAALGAAALVGFALYHRIRPNAALENETRKQIFEAVCAQPGLGVQEVSRLAGVSYSTATYHLERLVGAGMIVMTPDGNKLCYYKNGGAFTESERKILPLVKNEEAAKLFEAILDSPGTYRAALAERLGVTATTINWHLRRLREAGLVDETRTGRSAHLYAQVDSLRHVFLTLATKVETTEPAVAAKLRTYAIPDAGNTPGASA